MDHSEIKHLPKFDHTPAVFDAPSDCLLKAAAWLEKHGLCQSGMVGTDGSGCIVHATFATGYGNEFPVIQEAQRRLSAAIPEIPGTWKCLVQWNERSGVTQAEVIAKMRAVALGL
jgi:hypothetical protein